MNDLAAKGMRDFADRHGLSVNTYEFSGSREASAFGDDRTITSWELIHSSAMPECYHCIECHADEIFGMRIPESDPAIEELWNGIHNVEDDETTLSEVYLIDGYSGWLCCGGREFIRRMATVELRETIAEVVAWRENSRSVAAGRPR